MAIDVGVQCVYVEHTLTDRASTSPSNIRGGCQSGTWSAGQKKFRETYTNLQREHGKKTQNKAQTTKKMKNEKK